MPEQTLTETDPTNPRMIGEVDPPTLETPDDRAGSETGGGQTLTPGFDPAEFVKGLGLDPADPAKSFEAKFVPKDVFTRKTQDIAEDRRKLEAERSAIFEVLRNGMNRQQAPSGPTPEQVRMQELRELAVAGDSKALDDLVKLQAQQEVAPIREEVARRNALDQARSYPEVQGNWDAINEAIGRVPILSELANRDNYKYAPYVMLALGYEAELKKAVPTVQAQAKEIADLKAKLASLEKDRVVGLPPTTSRAGSTTGRPAAGERQTFMEDALDAFLAAGGRPEDFK